MTHLTIIGSGLAGVSAALAARAQGAEVTVITGAPGATAMASGAWDIAAPTSDAAPYGWGQFPSPKDSIDQLIRSHPRHPYALIAAAFGIEYLIGRMTEALEALMQQLPYRPVGSLKAQQALLTPLGTVKYTAFADPAHTNGNLLNIRNGRLLIAGLPGLAGFPPSLIVKMLPKTVPETVFQEMTAAFVEVTGLPQHSLSPFALAQRFDEDETAFQNFAASLKKKSKEIRASHILLPPVIGLKRVEERLQYLQKMTGAVCFESLATPPSVPGLRRQGALEQVLQSCGAQLIKDRVSGFRANGRRIRHLILAARGEEEALSVESVLLATGRFLSGGIRYEEKMQESLFGLPVFIEGREVGNTFVGNLVHRHYLAPHALFSAGVRTTSDLRAVNRWDEVIYDNLHTAGSVVGSYNAAAGGSGSGVALLSGWIAGQKGAA